MLTDDVQETMQRHEITSVRLQFGQKIDKVVGTGFRPVRSDDLWEPAVDIYEDDTNYYFVFELAGVCPDDIDLKIDPERRVMTLRGHRSSPKVADPQGAVRQRMMTIDHGRFGRSIGLPDSACVEKVSAEYPGDGMLWVTVAKGA